MFSIYHIVMLTYQCHASPVCFAHVYSYYVYDSHVFQHRNININVSLVFISLAFPRPPNVIHMVLTFSNIWHIQLYCSHPSFMFILCLLSPKAAHSPETSLSRTVALAVVQLLVTVSSISDSLVWNGERGTFGEGNSCLQKGWHEMSHEYFLVFSEESTVKVWTCEGLVRCMPFVGFRSVSALWWN